MARKKSMSVKLALKFSGLMYTVFALLYVCSVSVLAFNTYVYKSNELKDANGKIESAMKSGNYWRVIDLDIPYYIVYSIYDAYTLEIINTNDPFLPPLKITNGKAVMFKMKNFFSDGDLDIMYFAKKIQIKSLGEYVVITSMNAGYDKGTVRSVFRAVIFIAFPMLIVSFVVAFFIIHDTMKYVVETTKLVKEKNLATIAEPLPVSGSGDEFDELVDTFNGLLSRLNEDFERERNFTSNVSHELKTPIAVILGQSKMLSRWGKDDPVQLEKSLEMIINESHSMESIVTNLLQLSKLENGRYEINYQKVSVFSLFARIQEETISYSPYAKIRMEYEEEISQKLYAWCDGELLHQVLTVVVSNSIKFCGPEVELELKCFMRGRNIVMKISDNGEGFASEVMPHVFERFYRGDTSHKRKAGGSGLGLSIAQAIVNAMHGTIEASNGMNGGACITINLCAAEESAR